MAFAATGVRMLVDVMYPRSVPLAANTSEGDPGRCGCSELRLGADCATLMTQPAIASAPTVSAETINTAVRAKNRLRGDPRLRRRRRCLSRRLIEWVGATRVGGPRPAHAREMRR